MSKHAGSAPPTLDARGIVRKTALLNAGIIVSGLVTSACLGGPATLPIVAIVLGVVSLAAWAVTFAFISSLLLLRILVNQGRSTLPRRLGHRDSVRGGVGDEWVDGPY